MTREEAIKELSVEYFGDNEKIRESKRMAIKALEQEPNIDMDSEEIKILQKRSYLEGFHEALKMSVKQEPCEDAISREQLVRELNAQMAVDAISREVALDMLEHLPSIQPKPKMGHWIDHQEGRWIYAQCSECGTVHDTQTNYCPNCGAKMESEEME